MIAIETAGERGPPAREPQLLTNCKIALASVATVARMTTLPSASRQLATIVA